MADICLADTVDASKSLFEPIWIPRQVIIHHQVRSLEINTFARRVRGNQYLSVYVLFEPLLSFPPLLTPHRTVNLDNRFVSAKLLQSVSQVIQSVAMLCKNDQLSSVAFGMLH